MTPGPLELGIILGIVALLFGTKKLRSFGSDVGGAVKGFRSAIKDDESIQPEAPNEKEGSLVDDKTKDEEAPSGTN